MKSDPRQHISPAIRRRALDLRHDMTPAETRLWQRLRNRQLAGLKFRRQHPLGPFIADFYCAAHRLVVEVDGGVHIGQGEQDSERSRQLIDHGYRVIRITNREVEDDLEGVLAKILAACQESSGPISQDQVASEPLSRGCLDWIHG